MRTVELSDEVFERAERHAAAKGLSVVDYLERRVVEDTPAEPKATGYRADFPLIKSDRPGTLTNTKELIEQIELDDYLGRLGKP